MHQLLPKQAIETTRRASSSKARIPHHTALASKSLFVKFGKLIICIDFQIYL
jgi:hypothetical protein